MFLEICGLEQEHLSVIDIPVTPHDRLRGDRRGYHTQQSIVYPITVTANVAEQENILKTLAVIVPGWYCQLALGKSDTKEHARAKRFYKWPICTTLDKFGP